MLYPIELGVHAADRSSGAGRTLARPRSSSLPFLHERTRQLGPCNAESRDQMLIIPAQQARSRNQQILQHLAPVLFHPVFVAALNSRNSPPKPTADTLRVAGPNRSFLQAMLTAVSKIGLPGWWSSRSDVHGVGRQDGRLATVHGRPLQTVTGLISLAGSRV